MVLVHKPLQTLKDVKSTVLDIVSDVKVPHNKSGHNVHQIGPSQSSELASKYCSRTKMKWNLTAFRSVVPPAAIQ